MQSDMRDKSAMWADQGQLFSDRFAARVGRLVETVWFGAAVMVLITAGLVFKYRHTLKVHLEIWRLRHGRGPA